MNKTNPGNFFEDFSVGQVLQHATPKTVTSGDVALYGGLFGARFAVQSSDEFARSIGYKSAPVDDLLCFHIVFGKTVPDISLNAVANLGYAQCRFLAPVYPGDTLDARSEIIGLKQNSNNQTGIVYLRSRGFNQNAQCVLDYVRWVMVRKKDASLPAPEPVIPELPSVIAPEDLTCLPRGVNFKNFNTDLSGSPHKWGDYSIGERIDHVDGVTIEEGDHMMAARAFQNTARVHFDQFQAASGRFKRRLIYGGHIISLTRALSFNGLANAYCLAGINAGQHVAPCFAGDTIYAWSQILAKAPVPDRDDAGLIRVRTFGIKDLSTAEFPGKADEKYAPNVVLDLDYWLLIPR